MRNRIFAFLTALVLIFTLAPTFAHAASDDIIASGLYGDITWAVTEAGLMTFKGTGSSIMEDQPALLFYPWFSCFDTVTEIVVTGVAYLGYGSCTFLNLQSITFDNCIQSIGPVALDGCTTLKTVTFQGDPPTLGKWAFPEEGYEIIHPKTRLWTKDVLDRFYSGEPTPLAPSIPCDITEQDAYDIIIGMKDEYPEGRSWTESDYYAWHGGHYTGGYACSAFAFIVSDTVFNEETAVVIQDNITIDRLRVGDILSVNNNIHSVVVLEVHEDYIVLVEGNYNASIHWGRIMTAQEIAWTATELLTRYPSHTWMDATCTEPRGCMFCDTTEGEALGHDFDGSGICARCGHDQNAVPCRHNWVEATCQEPRHCTLCDEYEGEPLPHTLTPATCLAASVCTVCGTTQGVPSSVHIYSGNSDASCDLCGSVRVTVSGPVTDNITISDTELELLRLTNRERLARGLQPLATFAPLQEAGRIRAREIKTVFDHFRPNGEMFHTALYAVGLSGVSGENLARNQHSPAEVMEDWMSSPLHRDNILHSTFGRMAAVEDQLHWVQLFLEAVPYTTMQVVVPEGAVYDTGTAIRDMGLKVYLTDAQGTVYLMPLDDPFCTGYDPSQAGEQTVTVNLLGLTWDMTVTLAGKHDHVWNDATCEAPRTCELCGKTDGEPLAHRFEDGTCILCGEADPEAIVWGDANNSKGVDYLDAMLVLRHAVKLATLPKAVQDRCDVDRSGSIDYLDAMLILRYAVKLLDKLPLTK